MENEMKTCSLCKKSGHNRRTCKEPIESLPQVVPPIKVDHTKANSFKSNNGNALENLFIKQTRIRKASKKDKPTFINEHNIKQEIDFDFMFESKDGQQIFLDITTSYRSDRIKQKGYNALLLKREYQNKGLPNPKFIVGIGNLVENGKKKNSTLIDGIDEIKTVEEIIKDIVDTQNI
jgi:hypothetical protein